MAWSYANKFTVILILTSDNEYDVVRDAVSLLRDHTTNKSMRSAANDILQALSDGPCDWSDEDF